MTDEEYLKEDDFIENTYDELVDESEDSIFKRDKFLSKFNCIFLKQTYLNLLNILLFHPYRINKKNIFFLRVFFILYREQLETSLKGGVRVR